MAGAVLDVGRFGGHESQNTAGGEAAKQTKMVLRHPDRVEAECLGQERLVQHFTEKLLRVPASRPVGWGYQ